ncbi:Atrial natriuretic peptide receptor 2 [Hypsibius exemplaris]|uniref:guanylate cyclase n=1 Tax=Hypsibius exemplaris TaxID=2072580 RepID=A0A1W0X2H7_HYPEX|nr:Atrial natriuretic peptide receptor 2 [Hypsibius exemplaris]
MMTTAASTNKVANGNTNGTLQNSEPNPAKPYGGTNGYNGSTVTVGAASSMKEGNGSIMTGVTSRSSMSRVKVLMGTCADDPRTTKGRRMQLIKILGMAAIPIVILVIQSALSMAQALAEQGYATSFKAQVTFAIEAGNVVHALGLERGTTTFFVAMQNEVLLPPMLIRRKQVDESLRVMTSWPNVKLEDNFFMQKADLQLQLAINRLTVNASTPEEQLEFFTDIIAHILNWIGDAVIQSKASEQKWQELTAYHFFIAGKEAFAAERSGGTVTFGRGNMSQAMYLWYHDQRSRGQAFLNKSIQYNDDIRDRLEETYYGTQLQQNISMWRTLIDANNLNRKALQEGRDFYTQMSNYQNILKVIEDELTRNITDNLDLAIYHSNQTVGAQLFILILALILFPSIIILLRHITGQIQGFASVLQTKNEEVMKEKKRAEAVLNQLLPRQIAEKVKNRETIYPESYDQVTIFFSDIVEFTNFSSISTPLQIVDTLNKLYTAMDKRIGNYDVYKVETIGDAYLCASGLPERNGNRHSYEIASMSLDLISDISAIRIPHKPDYALRLRIGMHTGPCAAGIIGNKMPRYCIFGDTVNTASRMESHGAPLRIHLSSATHDALRYFGVFEMECRGEIEVKGKGLMTTWWLLKKLKEDKKQMFGPGV